MWFQNMKGKRLSRTKRWKWSGKASVRTLKWREGGRHMEACRENISTVRSAKAQRWKSSRSVDGRRRCGWSRKREGKSRKDSARIGRVRSCWEAGGEFWAKGMAWSDRSLERVIWLMRRVSFGVGDGKRQGDQAGSGYNHREEGKWWLERRR